MCDRVPCDPDARFAYALEKVTSIAEFLRAEDALNKNIDTFERDIVNLMHEHEAEVKEDLMSLEPNNILFMDTENPLKEADIAGVESGHPYLAARSGSGPAKRFVPAFHPCHQNLVVHDGAHSSVKGNFIGVTDSIRNIMRGNIETEADPEMVKARPKDLGERSKQGTSSKTNYDARRELEIQRKKTLCDDEPNPSPGGPSFNIVNKLQLLTEYCVCTNLLAVFAVAGSFSKDGTFKNWATTSTTQLANNVTAEQAAERDIEIAEMEAVDVTTLPGKRERDQHATKLKALREARARMNKTNGDIAREIFTRYCADRSNTAELIDFFARFRSEVGSGVRVKVTIARERLGTEEDGKPNEGPLLPMERVMCHTGHSLFKGYSTKEEHDELWMDAKEMGMLALLNDKTREDALTEKKLPNNVRYNVPDPKNPGQVVRISPRFVVLTNGSVISETLTFSPNGKGDLGVMLRTANMTIYSFAPLPKDGAARRSRLQAVTAMPPARMFGKGALASSDVFGAPGEMPGIVTEVMSDGKCLAEVLGFTSEGERMLEAGSSSKRLAIESERFSEVEEDGAPSKKRAKN